MQARTAYYLYQQLANAVNLSNKVILHKLQFIWIKIANNPLNTLHYLQKAHLSSDTKLIDLADFNIYDASVQTYELDPILAAKDSIRTTGSQC